MKFDLNNAFAARTEASIANVVDIQLEPDDSS